MPDTKLLYLTDSYTKRATAKIASIQSQGKQTAVTLNQTIFYPQGGGQPGDLGEIKGDNGKLKVTQVNYNQGKPLHIGKLTGNLDKAEKVQLSINWDRRYHNMLLHSAGHIVHEAVMDITYGVEPVEGMHGIAGKLFLKYKGIIDKTLIQDIEAKANSIVIANKSISSELVSLKKLTKEASWVPKNLPKNKPLRVIKVGEYQPIPDGGTQVKTTKEVGIISITDIDYDDGHSLVKYQIKAPAKQAAPTQTTSAPKDLLKQLQDIKIQVQKDLKTLAPDKKEAFRVKYLGRRGLINQLTKSISSLPTDARSQAGKQLNSLKQEITKSLKKSITPSKTTQDDWLDVTQPGEKVATGRLHPITQAISEITQIFERIGFTRVRYPEVDWDWYVFESLNMPPDHPARDEWETFFIDAPLHKKLGQVVLTTHTSNGQVREMERVKNPASRREANASRGGPPIRMLNIARCYRRQQDVTHTAMFHQFEGLVIDQGINLQHLKGTLDYFARHFYGPKTRSRIRPFMFKFTEPSFEVDFSCTHCEGKGCRFCKSGWHEVGGSGMVHPNVLRAGGIDPKKYTGFAFGWGIERVYTLKPGLELDDIRPLYSSNLDFLKQF